MAASHGVRPASVCAVTVGRATVYAHRVNIDNLADITDKIAVLRVEHRDLDDAIARLVEDADADEVAIKRATNISSI